MLVAALHVFEIVQDGLEIIFEGLFYGGQDFHVGVFEEVLGDCHCAHALLRL